MTLLQLEALDCRYGLLQAVRGVSFDIAQGETVALIGANGAGKTTLLRAIAGAHRPAAGRVSFGGVDITHLPAHRRVALGIALVPEGRRLFPSLTVEENLRVASSGRRGRWTVDTVLEVFPLLKPRRHMPAATLSGGEQQDGGLDGEGTCELEALALNQAKALGAPVRHVSEGALVEHLETEVVRIGAAAFAAGRRPDEHVLEHGHTDKWARHLVGAGDPQLAPVGGAFRGDVATVEDDAAAVRPKRPRQDAQQRRLACPVGPDDADRLAFLQGEVDTIEHRQGAKPLPDIDRGEDRRLLHYPAA